MANENSHPTLVVALNDLIFETKIRSTAERLETEVAVGRDATQVCELLEKHDPALLIVDLNTLGPGAVDVIRAGRAHPGNPFVLAFVSHMDQGLADEACKAGAHCVVPRSRFSNELPEIIREHCAGAK